MSRFRHLSHRDLIALVEALIAILSPARAASCSPGCWAQEPGAAMYGWPGEGWG